MSITEKVKYLKSVLRFLTVITVLITSILSYNIEGGNPLSFQQTLRYHPILPQLTDPFSPQEKTISLKSSHPFWNGRFLNATKKLRKIKQDYESGLIEGTIIMYHRFGENDLQIPAIMTLDWYRSRAIKENVNNEFKKSFIKIIKNKNKNNRANAGKDIMLLDRKFGDTEIELGINGYITVNGNLVFENKDLVTTNQRDSKNWDLEIEQTQRFNILGNIGERYFINIKQDSEADFTWENDLNIEYRGRKNEILQKAEAGNINLNLVGMDAVNMGGNNSSLFGIKAVYQLGPVEMQSVIAREQVKKSEKNMIGGMESGDPISINDYNFLVDRYFFIDDNFKNNFYPLTDNYIHLYDADYVIGDYEIYQMVTSSDGDPIYATAYVDPSTNETDSVRGNWKRLEEDMDYEIDRILGYLRVTSSSAQSALAIAYTTTGYNTSTQTYGTEQDSTFTNFKSEYIECINSNIDNPSVCEDRIRLKLIKDINNSTPTSPTWSLMFKNVYYMGGANIEPSALEVNIVRDEGAGFQTTHSDSGNSYLSIFGLDSEDQNYEKVEGGDNTIDLYSSIINYEHAELILPTYLPFSYNELEGNYHPDLENILPELNEEDNSPAMYYDNNTDHRLDEHEFVINVKTSTKSTSMDLGGFMIVEGSETVRLGGQILQKDVDYTIDYFSGKINFISEEALNPGAEISVSYEENQFISFDQKLLMGTYMKYELGEKNYLAGGMFYYNQSIAEQKVDIGYEPMRNFAWNITGKYQNELGFLTRAVDFLPLIETTKASKFSLKGNYAEIIPNPNPLGQAFIDDFEASKSTSSFSIMQRQWKMASPPNEFNQNIMHTINNRGKIFWYNPYEDESTQNIWPEQSTSSQANNNTTKIMHIETGFKGDMPDTLWNGIMIPFYNSEYDQSQSKYLDIWLNANQIQDDGFRFFIDIGHISEDWNDNGRLDTEDESLVGSGLGDGILSDGEDIGVDNCTDSYEDGWGGCLCNEYNPDHYDSDLNGIYSSQNEYCIDPLAITYAYADSVESELINSSENVNPEDPNNDNWCYNISGCPTDDYSQINGTEGNGQAIRYPDTEDMNKNKSLDTRNAYFTFIIDPLQNKDDENSMVVTETEKDNILTGWKLFRIPLISFDTVGTPEWEDVRSFRLRVESDYKETDEQLLKIAKIELVENEWKELGIAHRDSLDMITENPLFTVEVINTDESTEYKYSLNDLDIILEHDQYNEIDIKEQSLVLSFEQSQDNDEESGLDANYAALIKNTFPTLSHDKSLSYFAYENMEMFVHGGNPESNYNSDCNWYNLNDIDCNNLNSSDVNLLFRFGANENNYYEIRQPIYKGWDDRNHLNINIDKLTQLKIPILNSLIENLSDVGIDGCSDETEDGFGGCLGLDTLFSDLCESFPTDTITTTINMEVCNQMDSGWDPNSDNYDEETQTGTEGNDVFDFEDINSDNEITEGEAELAEEDYDGDGKYTPHPNQSESDNELFMWNDQTQIEKVCHNCSSLYIRGEPSINNIQNIIMGVINNSSERIYGKVLVNELRMTGVKKSKEKSYSIDGTLNFADLITITGNYKHKDSGFHKLQQRLGTGSSDETYSASIKLYPNIILPNRWGIKTPITLNYSNSIKTPKYYPGSDILAETEDIDFNIEDIQTKTKTISLITSFKKSSRSANWFIKRTIDNISLGYETSLVNKSNEQIQDETKQEFSISGSYAYHWGKENYVSPFKFTKEWLIIGNILSQARYYYTPDKLTTSIELEESDRRTIQRVNTSNPSKTYSFIMRRDFYLNHKFTKTFSSSYTRHEDSNLDDFENDKWRIIKDMDPGRIDVITEKFTNTYAPDFIKWLDPNITFNPIYKWNLNTSSDSIQTANVESSAIFKTKISFNIQSFIELIYTPENKGKSSRNRGKSRSSSRSNNNYKKINIKNPTARLIIGKIHDMTSKLKTISSTYTRTIKNEYNNIPIDLNPSYLYRFGLQKYPIDESGELYDTSLTNNNIVSTSTHYYNHDFRTSTNINITKTILANLDYQFEKTTSISSSNTINENESFSYYPLGIRGDKGFPISTWSINWSKIEKLWMLEELFKSVNLNHGFNGERSITYSDSVLLGEDYTFNYSPLIGFKATTKGHNPITINANYNLTQTIKNEGESTTRNHINSINVTVNFKKTGGGKINTFFFRDFYLRNNMDVSLTFNYNTNKELKAFTHITDFADFDELAKSMDWSLKPNISYTFTNWITGNFYMMYGVSETRTSGRKEERDFGFNMNIKIQG